MTTPCSYRDRDIIRRLAEQLAALARHPREKEKTRLWQALNGLRPERPLVYINQIPWGEFEHSVPELQVQCADSPCRDIETVLRRQLFRANHLSCDVTVDGVWRISKVIENDDWGVPQVDEERIVGITGSGVAAQSFTPVITDEADIEKIHWPEARHNEEETARRLAFAEYLFADILPVQACGIRNLFFKAWDWIVRRTGVTNALMDMAVRPDYMHALIDRLAKTALARIEQLETANLLDGSPPCDWLPPGPAGATDELPRADADPKHYRSLDLWGGASPQIFGEVSPKMHMEFGLRYENQVMSRCGLNYYGCCEPLHQKMDILATIPRLRKISISPWCEVTKAAASARGIYVFSHKPNPALLARNRFDLRTAEEDLRKSLRDSGPMPCEFTMKDISTVRGDVQRLIDWCRMAMRVVNEPAKA